jgi:hypothetical protein
VVQERLTERSILEHAINDTSDKHDQFWDPPSKPHDQANLALIYADRAKAAARDKSSM